MRPGRILLHIQTFFKVYINFSEVIFFTENGLFCDFGCSVLLDLVPVCPEFLAAMKWPARGPQMSVCPVCVCPLCVI